jgi:hypothetical protein
MSLVFIWLSSPFEPTFIFSGHPEDVIQSAPSIHLGSTVPVQRE